MLSSGFIKKFAVFVLIMSAASACRFWQSGNRTTPTPTPENFDEIKSEIPFLTKEPEVFQAEFVTIANETERRIFKARNGANRRVDYNFGAENEVIFLQTDKLYTLLPKQKIYTENAPTQTNAVLDETTDFLTNEWLNEKTGAKFEKLETIENQTKYRVLLDGKEVSEVLIYVDESLKIPVKQEFYGINGEQKTSHFTFELRNFKTQTDENLFTVPKDFKKVSAEEFRKILNK
ncbi:MAG TPA: hypothetical protein PKY59_22995 [Pyrinomonadaceae bacterium]|nr:hypothetical protein [Pyrinomonadaceae bacterium]